MSSRSRDRGRRLRDAILDPIDVCCPRCGGHACLSQMDGEPALHVARRLGCSRCGFTRDHDGKTLGFSRAGEDPCFGYPLWYRTETAKGTLWAYHRSHLEELRGYIAASNRDRSHMETWTNQGYFSRLPRWVKSAKHRDMLVKALDRMMADG